MPANLVNEREFQASIVDLARLCGWRVVHFHDSRREVGGEMVGDSDAKGWPDLTLIRDRILYREVKTEKGRSYQEPGPDARRPAGRWGRCEGLAAVGLGRNSGGIVKMTLANQETQGIDAAMLEAVVMGGDLAKMNAGQRLDYYARVCRSVGLNPLTKPFQYIKFQGGLRHTLRGPELH